ncbi:hypothetical protein [Halobacillus campisalis]|uniref:hypothetical protein n=1 Tax=Halobacillus campisalis TaxID=435909 RepID=UPI00259BA2ED|nr:hypothetical protein [Halobacillus campisalis]
MKTSIWFIVTVLFIYVGLHIFLAHVDVLQQNFLSFAVEPSKIYMLVMGTLSFIHQLFVDVEPDSTGLAGSEAAFIFSSPFCLYY